MFSIGGMRFPMDTALDFNHRNKCSNPSGTSQGKLMAIKHFDV